VTFRAFLRRAAAKKVVSAGYEDELDDELLRPTGRGAERLSALLETREAGIQHVPTYRQTFDVDHA
jgi:hypothetical protein